MPIAASIKLEPIEVVVVSTGEFESFEMLDSVLALSTSESDAWNIFLALPVVYLQLLSEMVSTCYHLVYLLWYRLSVDLLFTIHDYLSVTEPPLR